MIEYAQLVVAPAHDVAALGFGHEHEVAVERKIIARLAAGADVPHVTAGASEVLVKDGIEALGRILHAVERVVGEGVAHQGRRGDARRLLDRERSFAIGQAVGARWVGDIGRIACIRIGRAVVELVRDRQLPLKSRVAQPETELLVELEAGAQSAAYSARIVARVCRLQLRLVEQVEARGDPVIHEVRLGEAKLDAARALAERGGDADVLAAAKEVLLAHRHFGDKSVHGGVAAGDRELAGELFLHVHQYDHAVGRRAGFIGDLHRLEEVEVLQSPLGPIDEHAIVRIAFVNIELAPDHPIARTAVATNRDAFDVDARPFLDHVGHVDGTGRKVAVAARLDLSEGVAEARELDGDFFERLLHLLGVIDRAFAAPNLGAQHRRVDVAQVRQHVDLAELVLLALVEREGDDETGARAGEQFAAAARAVDIHRCRHDAEIGIAILEIEAAQQLLVGIDPVGIVDILVAQEA